jgi:hypothetical protein
MTVNVLKSVLQYTGVRGTALRALKYCTVSNLRVCRIVPYMYDATFNIHSKHPCERLDDVLNNSPFNVNIYECIHLCVYTLHQSAFSIISFLNTRPLKILKMYIIKHHPP